MDMAHYLPVMWNVQGLRCTIVGGGGAARRKAGALLEAGCKEICVIAPMLAPEIEAWLEQGRLSVLRRHYAGETDLQGSGLAVAATDDSAVNARVCEDAHKMGIPVLDAGHPQRGTFILPAVLRRGKLIMAVSTSGASPRLAVRLRDELAAQYGPEYAQMIEKEAQRRTDRRLTTDEKTHCCREQTERAGDDPDATGH